MFLDRWRKLEKPQKIHTDPHRIHRITADRLTPILSAGWWGSRGSAACAPPGMRSGARGCEQAEDRPTPTKSPI